MSGPAVGTRWGGPPLAGRRTATEVVVLVLFHGYVGLLIVAGAWGVVGARLDLPILLHLPLEPLSPEAAANLLSQYRFLRAIELGFGLFSFVLRRQIFTEATLNRLFLLAMGAGVVARLVSFAVDGRPSLLMLAFLAWEAVGVVAIAWHTRTARREAPPTGPRPAVGS